MSNLAPPHNGGPSGIQRTPFPHTPDAFESDPRVSYSTLDRKWILEDDVDGSEWEWEDELGKWVAALDEGLAEQQAQAYAVPGVESEGTEMRKRKGDGDEAERTDKKRQKKGPLERKNTAVYVTSLPLNVTVAEIVSVFKTCGVIAEEIDSGQPRVKLYTDADTGAPKGDALIVYFRPESVQLAIQMLDDSDFRLGEKGPAGPMRVKEADFSYKKVKDNAALAGGKKDSVDKTKIMKKTRKLNNKLADWDDDEPTALQDTSSRWDKVVYLKHMFTLQELQEDVAAILEIKDDIRSECSKLGDVTNVLLYDLEPAGIASVRFSTPAAATACVRLMHGRHFDGRRVEAWVAEGTERYRKTNERGEGEDGDEAQRLEQFGAWLEEDGGGAAAAATGEGEAVG